MGITQTTIGSHHTQRITEKEKSHVVGYHRNSGNPVAARLFRSGRNSKPPALRPLGSHSDRYRYHPHHIGPPWGDMNLLVFDDQTRFMEVMQPRAYPVLILSNGRLISRLIILI